MVLAREGRSEVRWKAEPTVPREKNLDDEC